MLKPILSTIIATCVLLCVFAFPYSETAATPQPAAPASTPFVLPGCACGAECRCEELRAENERLIADNLRLNGELAQLDREIVGLRNQLAKPVAQLVTTKKQAAAGVVYKQQAACSGGQCSTGVRRGLLGWRR